MYGRQFEEITKHIPGIGAARIREVYDGRLENFRRKGPWNAHEKEMVLDFVEEHGPGNWAELEKEMNGRSASDIRREWQTLAPEAAAQYQLLLAQKGELPTNFVGKEQHRPKIQASDVSLTTTDGFALEDAILDGGSEPLDIHASANNKHVNSLNKIRAKTARITERKGLQRLQSIQDQQSTLLPLCDVVKQEENADKLIVKKKARGRPKKSLSFDIDAANCSQPVEPKVEVKEEVKQESAKRMPRLRKEIPGKPLSPSPPPKPPVPPLKCP